MTHNVQHMLTMALLNQKGGVGKTTTTINLAGALTRHGYRVLMVDLDPQGHLTEGCGIPEAGDGRSLAETLVNAAHHTPEHAGSLPVPWLAGDLVPTSMRMFLAERELYRERAAEYRLQRLVELWAETGRWDICLIDCPPSLAILTDNALVAADQVLVPVQAEDTAMRALRLLMGQIEAIRTELRTTIDIIGMVVSQYDKRRGTAVVSVYDTLHQMPYPILATIPDRAAIREAWRAGQPVTQYAPTSDAANAYNILASALIDDTAEVDA